MEIFQVIDTALTGDTRYEGFVKDAANWAVLEAALSATTDKIFVAGGAGVAPVATTATGTGAPVRAVSPTITGTMTTAYVYALSVEVIMPSTHTLDAVECKGTIINNYGQTDDAVISLPVAASGMSFVVILGTTVAKYYRLNPDDSDSIFLTGTTTGDGKYVGIASSVKSAMISFCAFQVGATAYDWFASPISGTWVAEA